MTWKTIVSAKTTSNGMIIASRTAMTLLDLLDEAVISSLEERSMTKRIAINAPPMPIPIAVVKLTAVEEVVVTIAILILTPNYWVDEVLYAI
jgi:hypothetical protein